MHILWAMLHYAHSNIDDLCDAYRVEDGLDDEESEDKISVGGNEMADITELEATEVIDKLFFSQE